MLLLGAGVSRAAALLPGRGFMRVLVTGATGFIGRRLCPFLAGAGYTVIALARNPAAALRRIPHLAHALPWDPLTVPSLEGAGEVEAVVHLAGERISGRWTPAKKRRIWESRVLGTRNLVAALARLPRRPRVLVSASAIGYYGDGGERELTEDAPPGEDFLARVCVGWEEEARRAGGLGVEVVCLRLGVVFGRGGGALTPLLVLARLGLAGPIGSGRQWWSWVHMDDVIGAVRFLLERPLRGPINVTAPHPVRQRDLARALGRLLKRPAFLPTPGWALRLLLGEVAQELLSSRRVLPHRLLQAGYTFRYPDLEEAVRDVLAAG
jgi:uncharacterized protein (TIGR01777 family)